jgi:hypothetical protein
MTHDVLSCTDKACHERHCRASGCDKDISDLSANSRFCKSKCCIDDRRRERQRKPKRKRTADVNDVAESTQDFPVVSVSQQAFPVASSTPLSASPVATLNSTPISAFPVATQLFGHFGPSNVDSYRELNRELRARVAELEKQRREMPELFKDPHLEILFEQIMESISRKRSYLPNTPFTAADLLATAPSNRFSGHIDIVANKNKFFALFDWELLLDLYEKTRVRPEKVQGI